MKQFLALLAQPNRIKSPWRAGLVFAIWYVLCLCDHFVYSDLQIPHSAAYFALMFLQPACYAGLLTAIHLLLGRFRWLLLPFFAYAWVLTCVEFCIVLMIGACQTGDLPLIVLNSSWNEIKTFFAQTVPIGAYVGVTLALVIGGLAAKTLFTIRLDVSWRFKLIGSLLLVVPFVLLDLCLLPVILLPRQMLFSGFLTDSAKNWRENNLLYDACLRPKDVGNVSVETTDEGSPVGVFLIGESVTRNRMGIYGYARATTPCLQQLKSERLFVFQNLLGCWSNTQGALRRLLTELDLNAGSEPCCTLPEVCSRAGYDCILLSNQGHWGPHDSYDSRLFLACREKTWLEDEGGGSDLDLVRLLEDRLTGDIPKPTLAFMHQLGCHWPMTYYTPDYAKFPLAAAEACPEETNARIRALCNRYDNCVLQTDACFGKTVALLKRTKRPAFAVFVSDHGETPRQGSMRVHKDNDLWEIPMVVWVSEEYAKAYPDVIEQLELAANRRLQQDQLFAGLLTLFRITGYSRHSSTKDFLSSFFQPRQVRTIANGTVPYEKDR